MQHGDLVARIVERRPALDRGEQAGAEREHVGRGVRLDPTGGLRGQVGGGSGEQSGTGDGDVARRAGDAEVGDLRGAVAREQDVAGFDIAVHHARAVCGGEGGGHLRADVGGLGDGQGAALVENGGEAARGQVLHHQHGLCAVVGDVVDRDRVRVLEPGRDPSLAEGALPRPVRLGVVQPRGQQELLHRDGAVQPDVEGAPDDSHRAAADAVVEPVSPGDQPVSVVARPRPVRHPDRLEPARCADRSGPTPPPRCPECPTRPRGSRTLSQSAFSSVFCTHERGNHRAFQPPMRRR